MAMMRQSPTPTANAELREEKPVSGEGNRAWLARIGDADGVILVGGASLVDFRIRFAQSALRNDLTPSLWSRCGILLHGGVFATVPLDIPTASAIPSCNGVRHCPLDDVDDPQAFPNVAVIRFAKRHDKAIEDIDRVRQDRSVIDLPALILPWLGYVWGVAGISNPLSGGTGLPAAAFVETVFAMSGFELTPGLSSASSCPEAIWQSAKWWTHFYRDVSREREEAIDHANRESVANGDSATGESSAGGDRAEALDAAVPMIPTGAFVIRQRFDFPGDSIAAQSASGNPPGSSQEQ